MRFLIIKHNCGKTPVAIVRMNEDSKTHLAVEAYQRQLAGRSLPTGVSYQTATGTWIDALIASAKI